MCQHADRECFRCGEKRETLVHALKDYPNSKDVLIAGGPDGRIIDNNFSNCIDWSEEAVRILDKKSMANFITILRNSWNNRNKMMFSGKEKAAWVIWERAKSISKEFCFHNMMNRPILPPQIVEKWEKPPIDKVKVNFDAAISNDKIGFSVLARDDKGIVVGGSGFRVEKAHA
ncbi:hypothetical protein Godav_013608 [Gossypium davidsonii]|uniref:RNase H type-1 domain-containing protein n=2 Tax=Gossypium TaxID=3633 RepID=A0A7J8RGW9_GOSDV|nr:hypothetical protein [Gossypium davidsonii]MBA0648302.1 hypothetical protein [Gossypium klotzschianum]